MWKSRTILVLAMGLVLSTAGTAAAGTDQAIIKRLAKFGGLSKGAAKKVSKKVSKRMSKSADNFAPANDPLRVAVSQELFGQSAPRNPMDSAKVRLRLFSGLNAWALETLFKPQGGQIAACQKNFELRENECAALVAAAGNISVADAKDLAAGGAQVAAARPAPRRAAPVRRAVPKRGKSRFGSYDSGFRGGSKPAQNRPAVQPAPRPAARPAVAARPAAQPAVNTSGMSTAEAYRARRAARLARLQEERKRKKEKLLGSQEPAMRPAKSEPTAAKASPSKPAQKPVQTAAAKPAAAAADSAPEPAAAPEPKAEPAAEPVLDDDFLGDLLSDPLGGD